MKILSISQNGQVDTKYISADIDGITCELEGGGETHKLASSFVLFSSDDKNKPMNSKAMVLLHLMSHSTAQMVTGNAFIAQKKGICFTDITSEAIEIFKGLLLGGDCQ